VSHVSGQVLPSLYPPRCPLQLQRRNGWAARKTVDRSGWGGAGGQGRGGDERRARTRGWRAGHSAHRADHQRRGGGPAGARRPRTAAAPPPAALSGSLSAAAAGCRLRRLPHDRGTAAPAGGGRVGGEARRATEGGGSAPPSRSAPRSGCSARPLQPAPSSHIHSSEPGANGGRRRLPPAGRGAGCQHGLRTSRGGVAPSSARRNPRQQQGGCPPSRSGRSSSGSGLDRPF